MIYSMKCESLLYTGCFLDDSAMDVPMYFHLIYLNELEIIANCYQLTDNQSSIPTYVKNSHYWIEDDL